MTLTSISPVRFARLRRRTRSGAANGAPTSSVSETSTEATRLASSARWAVRVVVACADCATSSGPYPSWAQARLMAQRHDLIQHRGRAAAQVTDAQVCESCRRQPATTTWTHPPAGAPFALCAGCHPGRSHRLPARPGRRA